MRRGVVAVIPQCDRLLVIERSMLVAAPGAFCFPGGAVEAGEQEPEALRRELHEELGVVVEPQRRLWQNVSATGVQLSWWLASLDGQQTPVPNPSEVAQALWMTVPQMRDLDRLLPTNRHFLEAWLAGEFLLPLAENGGP